MTASAGDITLTRDHAPARDEAARVSETEARVAEERARNAEGRAGGVAVGVRRAARVRRVVCLAALALVVWTLAAWAAARALVVRAELEHADALVVMSGSADYAERAQTAARLFREGRAPVILLTDDGARGPWSEAEQRNPFFHERAREELTRAGVPDKSIELLPGTVTGTREEAALLRRQTDARGLRSLLVVTSAYHSRRALSTLGRAYDGSGVRLGLETAGAAPSALWWLSIEGWRHVAGEYAKMIYYEAVS